MHETVTRVRKQLREARPKDGVAPQVATRLLAAQISRALAEPLASQFDLLYRESHAWLRVADALAEGAGAPEALFGELLYVSRRIRMILEDLVPFLERIEDSLSEREEITHRESAYERDVMPFSRVDSTQAFRSILASHPGFGLDLASTGAQLEADLLKIVFLQSRLVDTAPKPVDLHAMVVELLLDARRHLAPAFEEGSAFMSAVTRASRPT